MRLGAFVDSVVPNYYPSWEYTSCPLAVCGAVLKDFVSVVFVSRDFHFLFFVSQK